MGQNYQGRRNGYAGSIQGNTARQLYTAPRHSDIESPSAVPGRRKKEVRNTLSIPYCLFLTAICMLILFMGAYYLEQQALATSSQKEISALEDTLAKLKKQNSDELNRIETSVNLEEIRDIAINELGMVYATQENVVLYKNTKQNYVSQYAEIPEEKGSFLQEIIKAK